MVMSVRGVGPAAWVGALCSSPGQWETNEEVEKSSCACLRDLLAAVQMAGAGVGAGREQGYSPAA